MSHRIYIVVETETKATRLVRASNKSQAIRFVAENTLCAAVASQEDLVKLLSKGSEVESAIGPITGDLFDDE